MEYKARQAGKTTAVKEMLISSVYEQLLADEHEWLMDGAYRIPTYEDVAVILEELVNQVHKSPTPISVEIGSLLVKYTDGLITVYVQKGHVS